MRSPRDPLADKYPGQEFWRSPSPYGLIGSVQAVGGTAAPLLAGFSFAITTVLLQEIHQQDRLFARWPELTLALLLCAGLALIGAVQAGMWARRYEVAPDALLAWHPEYALERDTLGANRLRAEQRDHLDLHDLWAERTRALYNLGILLLLAGIATTVVPPGAISADRWIVIGAACAGFAGEVAWVVGTVSFVPERRRAALAHGLMLVLAVGGTITLAVAGDDPGGRLAGALCLATGAGLAVAWLLATSRAGEPERPDGSEPRWVEPARRVHELKAPWLYLVVTGLGVLLAAGPGVPWALGATGMVVLLSLASIGAIHLLERHETDPDRTPQFVPQDADGLIVQATEFADTVRYVVLPSPARQVRELELQATGPAAPAAWSTPAGYSLAAPDDRRRVRLHASGPVQPGARVAGAIRFAGPVTAGAVKLTGTMNPGAQDAAEVTGTGP
jgi:hypothetical protein